MTKVADTLRNFEKLDYDYFLTEMLSRVPGDIDKREGSIIFDAMAPVAYNLAEVAIYMRNILANAYTQTAMGEFLDYKAQEKGLKREQASHAQFQGIFKKENDKAHSVEVGDRFASIGSEPTYYTVTEINGAGLAILMADVAGADGNRYIGQILPITPQNGLRSAQLTELLIPAQDEEDDESLRARLLDNSESVSYGGNVTDYIQKVNKLDGVGAVQVYPTWNGGGTVKLVILDNHFGVPSSQLLNQVQEKIDPKDAASNGYGIAPIGHRVTVVAPSQLTVGVGVQVQTHQSYTRQDLEPAINEAVKVYFSELRKEWSQLSSRGRGYAQTIYRNQLITRIMQIPGIVNVSRLTLNREEKDISLVFDNETSQLATLGTVVVTDG